jgi:hypothetical protein
MASKTFTKPELKKEITRQHGIMMMENFQNTASMHFKTAYIFLTENLAAFRLNTGNDTATVKDMDGKKFVWIHAMKRKFSGKWCYQVSYCTEGYKDFEIHEYPGLAHKTFYEMMEKMFKDNKALHQKSYTGSSYLSKPITKKK